MQVCTSLQTDNHASTPPLSFYRPDALPFSRPTNNIKAQNQRQQKHNKILGNNNEPCHLWSHNNRSSLYASWKTLDSSFLNHEMSACWWPNISTQSTCTTHTATSLMVPEARQIRCKQLKYTTNSEDRNQYLTHRLHTKFFCKGIKEATLQKYGIPQAFQSVA